MNTRIPLTLEVVRLFQMRRFPRKQICLRHYTDLSPEVASELLSVPVYELNLDGLGELSDEVAKALSDFRGDLSFGALNDISVDGIRSLSKACTSLRLSGLKRITDEQAMAFLDFPGDLFLRGLEVIADTPPQLELLSRLVVCDGIEQRNLRGVSSNVLLVLVNKAKRIDLTVSTLTVELANILAEHSGELSLYGLQTLEPDVARILSRRTGNLTLWSNQTIEHLPKEKFQPESLPWHSWVELSRSHQNLRIQVRTLSDDAACLLAETYRGSIEFDSLVDVSDTGVAYLSEIDCDLALTTWSDSPGHWQYMQKKCRRVISEAIVESNGLREEKLSDTEFLYLKRISPGIAKLLKQSSTIIRRLDELTSEVAEGLLAGNGHMYIRSAGVFDRETAAVLTRCRNVWVIDGMDDIPDGEEYLQLLRVYIEERVKSGSRLITLDTRSMNLRVAAELAVVTRPDLILALPFLETLDFSAADVLSNWEGAINFGNLHICDSTARLLGQFKAKELSFECDSISNQVAEGLASYKGIIRLWIKELGDKAAEHLGRHRNKLEFGELQSMSAVGANLLAQHRPRTRPLSVLQRHPELFMSDLFHAG